MAVNFEKFRNRYRQACGGDFNLFLTDASGRVLEGEGLPTDCECQGQSDLRRVQAAEQTRCWGDPVINLCCDLGYAMWAIPILENNRLDGALVVQGVDLESVSPGYHEKVQDAANRLLQLGFEENLFSHAEVTLARQRTLNERDRFLAIEASKMNRITDDLRVIYLMEEPGLLGAIKEGRLKESRSILNRILTGIYGLAGDRMELLKSCVLELVVMMNRAAVEAGADPFSVLGQNYRSLTELSTIQDEEELSDWVRRMLETLIDRIRNNNSYPHSLLLLKAVQYMRDHLHQHLSRDEVARIAGVSPSHFSRLMTERMGRSFSQLLSQLRVERAKQLLTQGNLSLGQIALECGFCDQSHMNKVFRAATLVSPGEYRKNS